jgi:hypothetical protein
MVRFTDVNEFLENLDKDRQHVERRIVRVTNLYQPSRLTPSTQHLSVVATARIAGEIVRLEVYCGDLWHLGRDDAVIAKATAVQQTLVDACARLDLDVRPGVITEGPEL